MIVGINAAVDYLADLGRHCDAHASTRREALLAAYRTTAPYERALLTRLIAGLLEIPKLKFYGITDPARFTERCSTVSVRIGDHNPTEIATFLGERGIFTWDGNFYAMNLTERLGVRKAAAACCASVWCTTTRWTKSNACSPRSTNLRANNLDSSVRLRILKKSQRFNRHNLP